MNNLMAAINWLKHGRYNEKKNLRYLSEVIRREESGEICTAEEMAITLAPTVPKSIRNAMRVLKEHGLVEIEGHPQEYSSSTLGHYVLSMFRVHDEEE
jgi:hypothetical protein